MLFGKFDALSDDNISIIDDSNLTSLSTNYPGSLFYEGDGNFLYLDGSLVPTFPSAPTFSNVIRIDTSGNCEIVCNVSLGDYYPQVMFPYNNELWGSYSYGPFLSGIGKFDTDSGQFITFNDIILTDVPNLVSWKIFLVVGVTSYNNKIYINMYVTDKENSSFLEVIAEYDPETSVAKFVSFVNSETCFDLTTL